MNMTTNPVDVEVGGHTYRVSPLSACELVDIRKAVFAGSHPGRLKLAAVVGKEEPEGSEIERARWEAALPLADAEALAEARVLNQRLGVEVYNRALVAIDGEPCNGNGCALMAATAGENSEETILAVMRAIQGAPEGKG